MMRNNQLWGILIVLIIIAGLIYLFRQPQVDPDDMWIQNGNTYRAPTNTAYLYESFNGNLVNGNNIGIPSTGVYFRTPGENNYDGIGFDEAKQYCENNNGRLASREEMDRAHEMGMSFCAAGWYDEEKSGFYLRDREMASNCDNGTWNVGFNNANIPYGKETPYGAYCHGPIPRRDNIIIGRYPFAV